MRLIRRASAGVLLAGIAVVSLPVGAADPERGRMLYENHCTGCHTSSVHDRSETRATSLDRVFFEVDRWNREQELGWNDSDVADVVEYLEETFYQFQ